MRKTAPWVLMAMLGVASLGCARGPLAPAPSASVPSASRGPSAQLAASLRAQLAGHLERARGCFSEALLRDPSASGLVRVAFAIEPSGRVDAVEVDAWSQDERMLAACVRSRLVALYFDPAPPSRAVHVERTFYFCPDEQRGMCRLGRARPVGEPIDEAILSRVDASLAERDGELEACAREVGGRPAVLDVRLELGEDGRIMAGQLHESFPADSALSRCAVRPLLGTAIEGAAPGQRAQLRYVFRLGSTGDLRQAAR